MAKRTPFIIERDYPNAVEQTCCFCEQRFIKDHLLWKKTWEHLDDNDDNEELWNLAWAHHHCNEKKRYDADLQILAYEKIKQNKKWEETFDFESGRERDKDSHTDELTEGNVNQIINKLVKAELESLLPENSIEIISYTKILRGLHYLTIQQTGGRGSEQATRRSLDAHCSIHAPWKDEKQGKGNRIIRRRKSGEFSK